MSKHTKKNVTNKRKEPLPMIEIKHVGMTFTMASSKINSLKEYVVKLLTRKLKHEKHVVLDDISFTVKKGEVMGIMGCNGAGKSTILKIIAGIMRPTKGEIKLRGSVVPMLELGCGFDPELTGKENIYLNAAILGFDKDYIESKYNEIVSFSELGKFINEPIRTYSSGMLVRLGFSIATAVKPQILICDEVLAVGDSHFQEKSKAKMLELMRGGATVLFVSHSIQNIKEICDRAVWLEKGNIKMIGKSEKVADAYSIQNKSAKSGKRIY